MTSAALGRWWRDDGSGFWVCVCALIFVKLVLVADLSVQIMYSPHDDSLYVERAYHLLSGDAFGPYDSKTLIKFPGLTLWLAAVRALHIPYLASVNAVFFAAGIYLATALLRAGVARGVVLLAFALYVFDPITFGHEWIRVLREPLSTGLFVCLLAAMGHIFVSLEAEKTPWGHLLVFSLVFAFSLYLREDDSLLWGLLAFFAGALAWRASRLPKRRAAFAFLFAAVAVPAAAAKGYEHELRAFVERNYGLPILHEMSEGEFPRLLAAIRSIDSPKDNRMVMVTQDRIRKISREVPEFRPVAGRLPPPGQDTYSCRLQGVCSEWSNGWMPFWVRDEAYVSGFMPDLVAGQDYFRRVRIGIENACKEGKLSCTPRGSGVVPPMELRWTRGYVVEAWRLVRNLLAPEPHVVAAQYPVYLARAEVVRMFRAVTTTGLTGLEWNPLDDRIATAEKSRGRIWMRMILANVLRLLGAVLLLAAAGALAWRLWICDRRPLDALGTLAVAFALYCALRLAALSYVAVFFGAFDSRMMFSLYTAALLLSLPVIADACKAWVDGRTPK